MVIFITLGIALMAAACKLQHLPIFSFYEILCISYVLEISEINKYRNEQKYLLDLTNKKTWLDSRTIKDSTIEKHEQLRF